MIKNRFLALAVAVAMMVGTAVPAFAADNTTTVSLKVEQPTNTYTLTVPADTTLNSDGTAVELENGIKITKGTLEDGKKLTVTATSANEWKMTATGVDTKIGYTLCSADGTTQTSWEFTKAEANATDGATKAVYAKADATDVASAEAGKYSDVITFTAALANAVTNVSFSITKNGATCSYTVTQGTTWNQFFSGAGGQYISDLIVGNGSTVNGSNAIVAGNYTVESFD